MVVTVVDAEVESARSWDVLAPTWELCALTLAYPKPELVDAVTSGEWADAAAEIAEAMGATLPENPVAALAPCAGADVDAEALLHELRAEHTRLFVGAPNPAVSPYEGVWRAQDEGVEALLFVNPHSMAVERFMKSCGLGRPEGTNEPLDFAATECEFLEYLAARAAGAEAPEEGLAAEDFPGGSPAAAYEQFAEEHAKAWLPRFAAAVAAESRHPLYRTAAHLLEAVVAPA